MPKRGPDPKWALVITCVLSHFPLLLVVSLLKKRKHLFEMCMVCFSFVVSFMYHLSESLQTNSFFLTEQQWHQLDNVGAITCTYGACVLLACLDRETTTVLQCLGFCVTLIVQQGRPWEEIYTIVPVAVGISIPVIVYTLRIRIFRQCVFVKMFLSGLAMGVLAIFFFILGLDDKNDPCRIFHGLFHVFIALCFYTMLGSIRQRRDVSDFPKDNSFETVSVPINV